ncbi:MAG: SHOCT domain-containing protein [Oscillospiraceae bacterium]|nr:SHOCT domain-containing protein [Oscillospiraceae bacterium]
MENCVFDLDGVRGRHMKVYDDHVVISIKVSLGSFLTGNISDGEKVIYYRDVIGVQFKEAGLQIGYIQLETASNLVNNGNSNFFSENSFTFDITTSSTNKEMRKVRDYIQERVQESKRAGSVSLSSPADELLKLKQLLDMGAITRTEFENAKKRLL